jgi:hypothetical protein
MLIPKVFHRIWLGGKPMPAEFEAWGESWLDLHPGWTMKLWTEKNLPPLKNDFLLARCNCLAQQSDLIRYEILEQEGGIYVDTDLECRRNIESLIEDLDFFAAWKNPQRISNALIGGVAGHPVFKDLTSRFKENFSTDDTSSMGPPYFARILSDHPDVKLFGERTFQAIPMEVYQQIPIKPMIVTDIPEESYVVNHHSGQWFAPSKASIREEIIMDCPLEPGPKTLMVFSHPNHELPVLGLVRKLKPMIIFLTDGGGEDRMDQSRRGLKGNLENAIFLGIPEKDFYAALLRKDTKFFIDVSSEIAVRCGSAPDRAFCDAVEFYNPVHDVSLPVTILALWKLGVGKTLPLFEVPLIYQKTMGPDTYEVQRAAPSHRGGELRWKLPENDRWEKVEAWMKTYTILSSTMAPVGPRPEVTAAIESFYVRGLPFREPGNGQVLRYERRGALLKELGSIDKVITRASHVLPTLEPMLR